jgi:hypothetical protein
MIARVKVAKQLLDAGLYEARGLLASIAGLISALGALAALDPAMLPASLQPYSAQIHDLGKWAVLIGVISGAIAAQSKPPIPPAPLTGAPSLLDDEREP